MSAHLGPSASSRPVYLHLHHLPLYDLCLLPDPHSDTLPERLDKQGVYWELIRIRLMTRYCTWVRASVLLISREKISEPAMAVKGVSVPRAWGMMVGRIISGLRVV